MSTTMQKETGSEVDALDDPFVVEADHPRNSDLLIQNIKNMRLRSTYDASKFVVDRKTKDELIPAGQPRTFPKTPGMRLHVDPEELTYEVIDPLHGDDELTDRIARWMRSSHIIDLKVEVQGMPPQSGKLSEHEMKTLCRELKCLLDLDHVKMVKGKAPEMDAIKAMPGKFLLNPGSIVPNTQPVYEEDMPAWVHSLSHAGG